MLIPIPEDVLQAQARDRALDLLLSGVGVSAAVASASFAAYMVVSGPIHQTVARQAPIMALASPPSHPQRSVALQPPVADAASTEPGAIDFDPTGSIPSLPEEASAERTTQSGGHALLPDFAVRDVFDGTALVEANGTLQMVRPGTVLQGAGTVVSISRYGNSWVVQTSNGVILQRR